MDAAGLVIPTMSYTPSAHSAQITILSGLRGFSEDYNSKRIPTFLVKNEKRGMMEFVAESLQFESFPISAACIYVLRV